MPQQQHCLGTLLNSLKNTAQLFLQLKGRQTLLTSEVWKYPTILLCSLVAKRLCSKHKKHIRVQKSTRFHNQRWKESDRCQCSFHPNEQIDLLVLEIRLQRGKRVTREPLQATQPCCRLFQPRPYTRPVYSSMVNHYVRLGYAYLRSLLMYTWGLFWI